MTGKATMLTVFILMMMIEHLMVVDCFCNDRFSHDYIFLVTVLAFLSIHKSAFREQEVYIF